MPCTIDYCFDSTLSKYLLAIDPSFGWIQMRGHFNSIQLDFGCDRITTDLEGFQALAALIARAALNLRQCSLPSRSAA